MEAGSWRPAAREDGVADVGIFFPVLSYGAPPSIFPTSLVLSSHIQTVPLCCLTRYDIEGEEEV